MRNTAAVQLLAVIRLWSRRTFVQLSAAGGVGCAWQGPVEQPAAQLDGETARAQVERYLERIEDIDRSGPSLNSVIEVNPDALAIADELDQERRSKGPRGPLHGVPILIKDNIDTGDRMQTTAGSLALVGAPAPRDSAVAARLRRAGAVILGKTNLSEWANFRSSNSTSGWSARGGLTRNPYALDHNTCGSSSGSGAAVAADLCAVAIGTETSGSIICPSSINGIVGIKPTVGLVPQAGIIPISHSQDTAGPMARTVADAAILLSALAPPTDYSQFLDAGVLSGARVGVARGMFGYLEEVDSLIESALDVMRQAGAELIELGAIPTAKNFRRAPLEVLLYEFKDGLNKYLAARPGTAINSLREAIEFNELNSDRELAHFGQELFEQAEAKGPLTDAAYLEAFELTQRVAKTGIDDPVEEYGLDAIVAPSTGPAWKTDLVKGDSSSFGSASLAARAGYPHITVPAGRIGGLPVGLSLFGPAMSEPKLIALAYAYEQATHHRKPPTFRPTAPEPSP